MLEVDRFVNQRTLLLLFVSCLAAGAQQINGIPKFREVNGHLYRGAQPSGTGLKALSKLGVVTVLDLRPHGERGTSEEKIVTAAGMRYFNVPMDGLHGPTDDQIIKALAVLRDPNNWPVFVHCQHGVDRTGTVIACYRIASDHWPNVRAEKEAEYLGMHSFERGMKEYILQFHLPGTDLPPALRP